MKVFFKNILFILGLLYLASWYIVVPEVHRELLKIGYGEPPLEFTYYESPWGIQYYSPYIEVDSIVMRMDHSFKKNRVRYREHNLSIVIPVLPFVVFYYGEFRSGEIFISGKKGLLYWYKGRHDIRHWVWMS